MALLLIGGPTAAGKTAAAIHVACLYGASIVSADAMLVYRGMNIGTAKPPPSVLGRYPHGAVDVRNPDEAFSVADFRDAVSEAQAASDRVVVVGGTPFYLSALVRPLAPMPSANPALREELETIDDLHAALRKVDPALAARLHPNDRVRLVRGLEVHALTGRPLSEIQEQDSPAPEEHEVVWLDRPDLDDRIDLRLERMVARGYVAEVQGLLDAGWSADLKPFQSLGYRHMVAHCKGELLFEEAVRRTGRDSRKFARKQRTWARSMGWVATDRAGALEAARRAFGIVNS